jgi:hypothetical protein
MKKFKIVYENKKEIIVTAKSSLEIVKKYDLATRENINTKIIELNC